MNAPEQSTHNIPDKRPPANPAFEEGKTISLLDILLAVVHNRRLIGVTTTICLTFGLLIAVLSPDEFTASASMIRETRTETSGAFAGELSALRGLGISIGGGSVGLTAETYPYILRSREVSLAIVRSEIYFGDVDDSRTLVDFYSSDQGVLKLILAGIKKVTISLPGTIMGLFRDKASTAGVPGKDGTLQFLTQEEEEAIKRLNEMLSVNVDRKSGIMNVSVTTHWPLLSAQITQSLIVHLTERVQELYTQKSSKNLAFIQARFIEVEQKLEQAEEMLASFVDRNQNPQTAKLQIELDRFKRKVTFKTQLYADLQTQLTQAEIELQRSQPVITLLEAPVPPLKKSGPRRKVIVLVSLFLGFFASIGLIFIQAILIEANSHVQTRLKLEELKKQFRLGKLKQ